MDKLVSPQVAKLAKEKGFDVPVQNRYMKDGGLNWYGERRYDTPSNYNDSCFQDEGRQYTSAPTQSELQTWLRDVHKIDTTPIHRAYKDGQPLERFILFVRGVGIGTVTLYSSYEEAMEISLEKALYKVK